MMVVVHQLRVIDTLRVHSGLDRRVVNHVVSLVRGTKVTPGGDRLVNYFFTIPQTVGSRCEFSS